nr:nuclear transport factor 2 family protein [Shewanella acanthi]
MKSTSLNHLLLSPSVQILKRNFAKGLIPHLFVGVALLGMTSQWVQASDTGASTQIKHNQDEQAAAKVLDALNQYSSSADWDKYFALYRKDGIFIGTDATERWGMAEFERYSRPTKGWRYDLTERHLIQHGDVILFDELLNSPSYGMSRGTGTLIKTEGEWKIAQYHLSFPIPNGIAKQITQEIKSAGAAK